VHAHTFGDVGVRALDLEVVDGSVVHNGVNGIDPSRDQMATTIVDEDRHADP